jgi:hypothetical protein
MGQCRTRIGRFFGQQFAPAFGGILHRLAKRFSQQVFLGGEVAVEAAVRQAGAFHQVGHADAVIALFPE